MRLLFLDVLHVLLGIEVVLHLLHYLDLLARLSGLQARSDKTFSQNQQTFAFFVPDKQCNLAAIWLSFR